MDAYYFTEMPYHPGWERGANALRNSIPSEICDPAISSKLYNRYLDEYVLCDELGINVMVNEHHTTTTCLNSACTLPLAILARQTKKVKLLALGMPVGNRSDPVRVAEEFAMVDVISGGRVEMGLVKGGPSEIHPANSNPVTLNERFWEAVDLIVKAMKTHDGPFSWEGKYYQYRLVNVWPRVYQNPHPPIWMPVMSPDSAVAAAARDYTIACLNTGYGKSRVIFDAYRKSALKNGWPANENRLAYMAIVGIGQTKEEGFRRANAILDYIRSTPRKEPQFGFPLGYTPPPFSVRLLKDRIGQSALPIAPMFFRSRSGENVDFADVTVENAVEAGCAFAGTPDMVFEQLQDFYESVGGFGHLIAMAQGGGLSHEDAIANLKLLSRELLPRMAAMRMSAEPALAAAAS